MTGMLKVILHDQASSLQVKIELKQLFAKEEEERTQKLLNQKGKRKSQIMDLFTLICQSILQLSQKINK